MCRWKNRNKYDAPPLAYGWRGIYMFYTLN
nr:MAG TPA: hypothetical protein [Caudoviricetes sp.]